LKTGARVLVWTENILKKEHFQNNGVTAWVFLKQKFSLVNISQNKWLLSALIEQNIFHLIQFCHENQILVKSLDDPLAIIRPKKTKRERKQ